jgi:hypothetical protein
VGDIAGEKLHRRCKLQGWTLTMYLREQDIHDGDVVTGLDETARKQGTDESCTTGDEHRRCQKPTPPVRVLTKWDGHTLPNKVSRSYR